MRLEFHALLVLLAVIAAILAPEAAADDALVKPSSYYFAMRTLLGDDSATDGDFTKLTNGQKGGPERVIWRKTENHGVPLTIAFEFPGDTVLNAITVHYFRWKRSYGLKDIKAVGINAAGERFPLGAVTLNQPYHLPEGEPHDMAAVIPAEDPRPVRQVEVTITGTGGYVGVTEIEFAGNSGAAAQPEAQAEPAALERRYDFLAAAATPGLRLRLTDDYAVLENDHAIYVIDAACGGTVNYAYDKHAQVNLVKTTAPGQGYGALFTDRFWPGNYAIRDMYRDLPYAMSVLHDEAGHKAVRVAGTGKSGLFLNVTIEKTYTLAAGSAVLKVDYKVSNAQANVVPVNHGLWLFSAVQTAEPYQRIFPGRSAVESHPGTGQFTSRALTSGWFGVLCGDRGLALTIPYDLFKELTAGRPRTRPAASNASSASIRFPPATTCAAPSPSAPFPASASPTISTGSWPEAWGWRLNTRASRSTTPCASGCCSPGTTPWPSRPPDSMPKPNRNNGTNWPRPPSAAATSPRPSTTACRP